MTNHIKYAIHRERERERKEEKNVFQFIGIPFIYISCESFDQYEIDVSLIKI